MKAGDIVTITSGFGAGSIATIRKIAPTQQSAVVACHGTHDREYFNNADSTQRQVLRSVSLSRLSLTKDNHGT